MEDTDKLLAYTQLVKQHTASLTDAVTKWINELQRKHNHNNNAFMRHDATLVVEYVEELINELQFSVVDQYKRREGDDKELEQEFAKHKEGKPIEED